MWLIFGLVTVGILCLFSVNLAAQSSSSAYSSTSSSSSGSTSTEQESDQETDQLIKKKRRLPHLNGHTYIASSTMPQTPFVTTYFRNSTGMGRAIGYDIPVYDSEGELITTVEGKLTYMMLEISYQQALNDWLAVWLTGAGVGRVGVNAESVLSQGLSGVGAIELGGLARILNKDKLILSGTFSLRHNKQIGVNIIGFAKSIIDTGIIDEANLLTRIPAWRYKGGLRFAYAVNDLLGFILTTDLGFGDNLEGKDKSDTVFDIGGLASLDLNTRTKLPIGLLLGYSHTSYPESSGDIIERIGAVTFRIAYTGSREFSLGLEFAYASAPLKEADKSLNYGATYINLQYYF